MRLREGNSESIVGESVAPVAEEGTAVCRWAEGYLVAEASDAGTPNAAAVAAMRLRWQPMRLRWLITV